MRALQECADNGARTSKTAIACMAALILAAFSPAVMAGAFIGSLGGGSSLLDQDFIMHPAGYLFDDGVNVFLRTAVNINVCIVPGTPNAAQMVVPVANIAAKMSAQQGRSGNLVNANSGDNVPFSEWDFESVALHEVGHCLGLAHVNAASESGLTGASQDYTKAAVGANAALNLNDGADNRIGSRDDLRSDDINVHWFRRGSNNPCAAPGTSVFDSTTYRVDTPAGALPVDHTFVANADEDVCSDLGAANTEAVMQQGSPNGQSQRFLGHDDAATLRLAMSGLDELQGTGDDYTLTVTSLGISDSADCDINLSFNNAQTGFAVCQVGYFAYNFAPDHAIISSANAYFNTNAVDWFFNTSSPAYSLGGSASGVAGSGLVLAAGGQSVPVAGTGSFTFPNNVTDGSDYEVTVSAQPSSPTQNCVVSNATGRVLGGPVTDVAVACTTLSFPIGGNVSGLAGSGLVLQNNLGDDLTISSNGEFTFATEVLSAAGYAVTVKTQPANLSQTCTVGSGTGTVLAAPVANITVSCVTNTFSVGGSVSGLTGGGLVLQNTGGELLNIAADGPFQFITPVADGSNYNVTVSSQPDDAELSCNVADGIGTVAGTNIANVSVECLRNSTAGITVSAVSGDTTEDGGTAGFSLVLDSQPTADVAISLSSSNVDEGTVAPAALIFSPANWDTAQAVVVTGVADNVVDEDVDYVIIVGPVTSGDILYNGLQVADVPLTNLNTDLPPMVFKDGFEQD